MRKFVVIGLVVIGGYAFARHLDYNDMYGRALRVHQNVCERHVANFRNKVAYCECASTRNADRIARATLSIIPFVTKEVDRTVFDTITSQVQSECRALYGR